MKHARQKIREQVETVLGGISGVTVYRSRVYPMVTLPVISVYANDEISDLENETMPSPVRYTRRLRLSVEIAVSATTGADDDADDYAAQAEALLHADPELGGYATDSKLVGTQTELGGDQDKPIVIARLIYEVWYRTTGTDPETAL